MAQESRARSIRYLRSPQPRIAGCRIAIAIYACASLTARSWAVRAPFLQTSEGSSEKAYSWRDGICR
jgi:hypothetical protein